MLYAWSANGQLACIACMKQQKAFRLKNDGKFLWFDCHQCLLPRNQAFRRNRTSFTKDKIVTGGPPHPICGEQLYAEVEHYRMVMMHDDFQILGFKENEHNWTKKSIF